MLHINDFESRKIRFFRTIYLTFALAATIALPPSALSISPAEDVVNSALHDQQEKNYGSAIAKLSKAIETHPSAPELYARRADCYQKTDQLKLALNDCDKAIKISPSMVDALVLRCQILDALHRKDEAVKAWRLVVSMEPFSAEMLSHLAMAELRAGHSKKAIDCFEKAINIHPTYNDCYQLAELMRKSGKIDLAEKYLQKGRECPENGIIGANKFTQALDPRAEPVPH